jgi:DNA-binding NarL/FixJ family response regulator
MSTALAIAAEPLPSGPSADAVDGRLTVLVIDAHELMLYGMRVVLAQQSWVERCLPAADLRTAVELASRYEPDVALVGAQPGPRSAEDICRELRGASRHTRPVLLTAADRMSSRTVAAVGAWAYASTGWAARDIVQVVRLVGRGIKPHTTATKEHGLSTRQHEILQILTSGATNDQIARRLHLSPNTVKQHMSALYRKLEARNRAEAIGRAQAMGLLH